MDARQFLGSSNYLKAADLQGQTVPVTIKDVSEETVGESGKSEQKLVVHFINKEKALVLNVTNTNTIAEIYGFETMAWTGRTIELFPTTTDYQGKLVDCIRIRIPQAAQAVPLNVGPPAVPPPNEFSSAAPAAAQTPPGDKIPF